MWYSHRVTSRLKLCIQAKSRSTFQRFLYRRSGRPSWVLPRLRRLGAIISMPYSSLSLLSSASESYALSPISRAGSSSRKLPARTSSTSRHSAGEALCTDTASGRLLSAATATILVPLPRRVGPTARPPFLRSRRLHPRTPPPDSVFLARADAGPAAGAPLPACPSGPTAGTGGGRSGTEDTFPASPATALPFPEPIKHRAAPPACHATAARDYPRDAQDATPVPPPPIVLRSIPSVPP